VKSFKASGLDFSNFKGTQMPGFTYQNKHLGAVVELLRNQHEASMKASDNDPEAALSVDSEQIELCRRIIGGIAGKPAEDIELEGSKKEAEIHGTGGRPTKDGDDPAINRNDQEVATGDRRASDRHLAFDKQGRSARSVDAIFATDNASRYSRPHSIDAIFGEDDGGSSRGHNIDSIFGS
jgi:hypothetical protein